MKRSIPLPSVAAALALLLVFASAGMAATQARQSQEDDIREAVFRWQFNHNVSGLQTNAKVYFLAVGEKGGDPSDEFMKRFVGNKPPVRKRSQCTANAGRRVLDKQTGEQGLIFNVTSLRWISDTEVVAEGGYYEAGLSASGNIYTLKQENGKWKVTKDKLVEIAQAESSGLHRNARFTASEPGSSQPVL